MLTCQLSPASESSARPLVTVSPTRLCFNYELGQETMRELVVTNIAGKHVAFKVKATTAMWNLFIVKPQLWSLGAGSSTRIEVS